ncbi:hypothetical protein HNQ59_001378 [Chitinivorax tropicus]|uniref:Ice-binding protein C-terminal domain-containing protein n=1 Tax=Chitinivorax tropicus TaxID=714531 RepID=A0A840MPI6_9PROT|nr:PEP-CTERM sorting domain-containing protein [Chitinivorax tropicus]MBB5018093.1 hypothetical protein [Chitinivorax tropicus]
MIKASIIAGTIAIATVSSSAFAGFINGDFEQGNTTGWTVGTGNRATILNANLDPMAFLPGGSKFNANRDNSAIVSGGFAPHTDNQLKQVYAGNHSMRVEDVLNGGYASVITQKVGKYQDKDIFFAWAAVLEGAHDSREAATFKLVLRDETRGLNLITREYNADQAGGGVDKLFSKSTDGYFYTSWQVEQLSLDAAAQGNDISLTLLAADCSQTGHGGWVYLDGFGQSAPSDVPAPGVLALMGLGLCGLAAARRKR